jgi:hypothetical protein
MNHCTSLLLYYLFSFVFAAILFDIAGHLFIVPNVEKVGDNFVGAGTFHTATKAANGTNVTMPCLVRLETKPNIPMIRITVHSGHPSVSESLLHSISTILNAKE